MLEVTYTSAGRRAFRALLSEMQARAKTAMTLYAETGRGDVVELQGVDGYRLRVGSIRVLFALRDGETEVYHAGPRGDVYK